MQIASSRIKTSLIELFSILIVFAAVPDHAKAAEASMGKYVFEYCHSSYGNSGSLQTYDGFVIDNEGLVWSYEHGDNQWSPGKSDGPFYENELNDKYGTIKQVGNVDKSVLSAMASLIEPAASGETISQGRRVAGMDTMSYRAYLHDAGQDTYKEVVLSVRGSGALQNTSSAAKTLVAWLASVFSQGRPSDPSEPSYSGVTKPAAGTAVPKSRVIQKIPAPKPDIKVENKGPFPIEDPSK